MTSTDPLFASISTALSKFSAEFGQTKRSFSVFIPIDSASEGSNTFSTSKYAQIPAQEDAEMEES